MLPHPPKILGSASSAFNPLLPNKTYSPLLILLCACLQKPKIDWDKLAFLSGLRDPAEANQTKCLFSSHEYIVSIHNQMPTSLMRPQWSLSELELLTTCMNSTKWFESEKIFIWTSSVKRLFYWHQSYQDLVKILSSGNCAKKLLTPISLISQMSFILCSQFLLSEGVKKLCNIRIISQILSDLLGHVCKYSTPSKSYLSWIWQKLDSCSRFWWHEVFWWL